MPARQPPILGLGAFTDALCDDLNVARAFSAVSEAIGAIDTLSCAHREMTSLLATDSVLGVLGRNVAVAPGAPEDADLTMRVESFIARRAAARSGKDWAESDRIRDGLAALGVFVKDGPFGSTCTLQKDGR